MTSCPNCQLKFSDPGLVPPFCPNCGERLSPENGLDSASGGLIGGYFRTVWRILTEPSAFFRAMPLRGGVAVPLAFALVTHWLGSAIGYVWRILIGGVLGSHLERLFRVAGDIADVDSPGRHVQLLEIGDRFRHWVWGTGSVIADPFLTLARILFISFLVFLGARILVRPGRDGAPREVTYESALRIICYGLTPSILTALPLFGGFIAALYGVIVTVIGARETYQVGSGRATVIALFPQVLLLAVVGVMFFAILVAVLKFMTTMLF